MFIWGPAIEKCIRFPVRKGVDDQTPVLPAAALSFAYPQLNTSYMDVDMVGDGRVLIARRL